MIFLHRRRKPLTSFHTDGCCVSSPKKKSACDGGRDDDGGGREGCGGVGWGCLRGMDNECDV